MPTFVFDEERVTVLAQRCNAGADSAERLAASVAGRVEAIGVLEHTAFATAVVGAAGSGSEAANDVAVANALGSADVDLELLRAASTALGSLAEVWRAASTGLVERVIEIRGAATDLEAALAGDLLAELRAAAGESFIRISGVSVRSFATGLPEPGARPGIDAALTRFDSELLPGILAGDLDPDSLSGQQQDDLRLVTGLLGGEEQTFTERRRDLVEVAGEDQSVIVENEVPFTRGSTAQQLRFVRLTVLNEAARSATNLAFGSGVVAASGNVSSGEALVGGSGRTVSGSGDDGATGALPFQPDFGDNPTGPNQTIGPDVTVTEVPTGNGGFSVEITSEQQDIRFSGSGTRFDGGGVVSLTGSIKGVPGEVDVVVTGDIVQVETRSPVFDEPFAVTFDATTGTLLSDDPFVIDLEDLEKPDPFDTGDADDNDPFSAPNDDTFTDDDNDGFDDGPLSGGNNTDNPDIGGGLE